MATTEDVMHPVLAPELRGNAYHLAECPPWRLWREGERPLRELTWSTRADGGFPCPPRIGDKVGITFNGFGTGTVVAYFREAGFLGVEVKCDQRPEWHIKQNGDTHAHPMVFGAEIEPVL
jgi:hypothetical protein